MENENGSKSVKTATEYVVLHQVKEGESESWEIVGSPTARSAAEAIRLTVDFAGMFVAVPRRSWTPTPVKVETETKVRIGA